MIAQSIEGIIEIYDLRVQFAIAQSAYGIVAKRKQHLIRDSAMDIDLVVNEA